MIREIQLDSNHSERLKSKSLYTGPSGLLGRCLTPVFLA